MAWGAVAAAGIGALGSVLGAKKSKPKAPTPWSTFGPAGSSSVNKKTKKITFAQDTSNPFYQLFNQLGPEFFANALGTGDEPFGGVDPEVLAAYEGLFGQGLTDRIASQYDLLTQMAAPEEQRAFNRNADALFARTGLSTSGDADKMARFMEMQQQADLQRQLAAVGLGRDESLSRFEGAMKAAGLGQAGQAQQFGFGMSTFGGLQDLFGNLMRQASIGTATPVSQPSAGGQGWMAGMNFLNNSGLFDALGRMGQSSSVYPGGMVPMVSQPNLGFPSVTPPSSFPMPQVWGL